MEPTLKDEDLVFDWQDSYRVGLIEYIKVPVRGKEYRPAIEVYAGHEWTGNYLLKDLYDERSDRYFLNDININGQEKGRWERLYRWVGVGWYPKVIPIALYKDETATYEGSIWRVGKFEIDSPPNGWREYCQMLENQSPNKGENRRRKTRLRENWNLDGNEKVLKYSNVFQVICENWTYYKKYLQAVWYSSNNMRKDDDNWRRTGSSYLSYLFNKTAWIPVKEDNNLHLCKDVFIPGPVLNRLKGWVYHASFTPDEDCRNSLRIRKEWKDLDFKDWHRWLERATTLNPNISREHSRAIETLYRAALNHWTSDYTQYSNYWKGAVWGIEKLPDGTKNWKLFEDKNEIFYVDRPDLESLRLSGLWVFPVVLGHHENQAKTLFKIERLSKSITGKPVKRQSIKELGNILEKRKSKRMSVLKTYLGLGKNEDQKFDLENILNQVGVQVTNNLEVQFSLNSHSLGDPQHLNGYYQDDELILWLDLSDTFNNSKPLHFAWEWFSKALTYAAKLQIDKQANIRDLLVYSDREIPQKLIDLGLTKEDVEETTVSNMQHKDLDLSEENQAVRPASQKEKDESDKSKQIKGYGNNERPSKFNGEQTIETDTLDESVEVELDQDELVNSQNLKFENGNVTISQSKRKRGLAAEDWLREEIEKGLPKNWDVIENSGGGSNPYDIEISKDDRKVYIEAKADGPEIFFSKNEVSFAHKNMGNFYLALVGEEEHNGNRMVRWIFDPLEESKPWIKGGHWKWTKDKRMNGKPEPWKVPKFPRIKSFHIKPRFSFIISLPKDVELHEGLTALQNHLKTEE